MKKTISIITSLGLLFATPAFAQDDTADAEEEEIVMTPPRKPINSSETQNWLFAGGSLLLATAAILLVAFNPGSTPPANQQILPE